MRGLISDRFLRRFAGSLRNKRKEIILTSDVQSREPGKEEVDGLDRQEREEASVEKTTAEDQEGATPEKPHADSSPRQPEGMPQDTAT